MAGNETTNYKQGYSRSTLSSHASRTVESDAAFLLPHIKPSDKILDVGCGPGTITAGLARHAPEGSVVGVDLSQSVLDDARRHLDELRGAAAAAADGNGGLGEVSFQAADVLAGLPFADGAFDVVYSSQLFPHLPPPGPPLRAMREMRRVLRPGGVLACRDVAEIHWYPRRLGLDRLHGRRLLRGVGAPDFPGPAMPALLRAAGFDVDGDGGGGAEGSGARIGAGTTVYSGPEGRRFLAGGLLGRLEEGDPYRRSWVEAGISEAEIEETRAALREWVETEDAWYVAVQSEVLAWK